MVLQRDDRRPAVGIPPQRTSPGFGIPAGMAPTGAGELLPARRRAVAAPTVGDVGLGVATLAVDAARSVVHLGVVAGQRTVGRLPVPTGVRTAVRRVWLETGRAGMRSRTDLVQQLGALLDQVLPLVAREVLARVELTRLVTEFVDLDRIAAGLDVDTIADRIDVDRVADRVDLDRAVARVDIDRIVDRIDLDELAARIDLDRILDRVDLDGLVGRVDLDPILERADVVGLARYVIDEIDLPELIRSSTGSMTSDMVRGVRVQGADADEAVQRVVDRLLRRRGHRDDQAPGGER